MATRIDDKKKTTPEEAEEATYIEGEGPVMSFLDHLSELRKHLMRAGLALIVATVSSLFFTGQILQYLLTPYGADERLQILGPTESVVVYFRVALLAGAILAMPVITWQLFAFILPGLTAKERRWVLLSLPAITIFFLVGVGFAWFIMTPAALKFLAEFQSDVFKVEWTADAYIAFVTALLFWIGAAFETPLILTVLARLGLVGPRALIRNWRLAVVATAILAALITPTIDPFNMALVMGPLLALYVLSIFMTAVAYRRSGMGQAEQPARRKSRFGRKSKS